MEKRPFSHGHLMKWIPLALMMSVIAMPAGRCGKAVAGDPISAGDLAAQLGVHAFSFVYEQDAPFTKAKVKVLYKKFEADGTPAPVVQLGAIDSRFREDETRLPIKVLLDAEHCTLIVGRSMSRGSGCELDEGPRMSFSQPEPGTDGEFILLIVGRDRGRAISLENAKGYLAVEIETE